MSLCEEVTGEGVRSVRYEYVSFSRHYLYCRQEGLLVHGMKARECESMRARPQDGWMV